MNFLIALLIVCGLGACLLALMPILTMGAVLMVCLGMLFLWLLPILIIADSEKTSGGEKLVWILAIIFLSWFAWILYFLLAPIRPKREYHDPYAYYYD